MLIARYPAACAATLITLLLVLLLLRRCCRSRFDALFECLPSRYTKFLSKFLARLHALIVHGCGFGSLSYSRVSDGVTSAAETPQGTPPGTPAPPQGQT